MNETETAPRVDSTLSKGLQILEALAAAHRALGVTELSRQLGLTKSNTFRLLQTLTRLGYVAQEPGGGYRATLRMWQTGQSIVEGLNYRALAAPEMAYLSAETGETVYLAVPEATRVIYIDKIDSAKPIRSWNPVGGSAPIHAVSTGKAILARNYAMMRAKLPDPLEGYTDRTITRLADLDADIAETRTRGYAVDRGELRDRVLGFAAAICLPEGEAVAALGVSLPDVNLPEGGAERYGALCMHAAAAVSRKLARGQG
ncbi:helix-turn-helix domain-containing protein [Rhodobacterales bacterium HKCCE3408]|nr:helix-turn-helix domain-containing protein [Rhodobacterales bacterium HKCCE3408]